MQHYEVIRFVQQNGKCHIIMDYVEGELLSNFIAKNKLMEKKQFYDLLTLLSKELENLEKSKGFEYYPHLTPFHIIIKKDNQLALLKCNEIHDQKYEKFIHAFMPLDGTTRYEYSWGKTVQFLLAKTEMQPKLSRKEIRKLQKIISKCLSSNPKKRIQHLNQLKRLCIALAIISLCLLYEHPEIEKNAEPQVEIEKLLTAYENMRIENRELRATLYQARDEMELAREEYQILVMEDPTEERYLALAALEEQCGRHREALSICEKGSAIFPDGVELQLQYVRLLLMDSEYKAEVKKEKLETFLALYPMLKEENRLERMKEELGFQEGEVK